MGPGNITDRRLLLFFFLDCKVASDVIEEVNLMYNVFALGM